MTKKDEDDDLPVIRELKEETEELIRIFDEVFLHTCGIEWDGEPEGE